MPPSTQPSAGIKWHEVTWYSKLGAILLFLGVVPALCFYIGTQYEALEETNTVVVPVINTSFSKPKPLIEGTYYRYRNNSKTGELKITPHAALWHVQMTVSGEPNGEATGGDCYVEAEGSLVENRLVAQVVPFDSTTTGVTAEDIRRNPTEVSINFSDNQALVQSNFDGCGVGVYPSGTFIRSIN